MINSIDTESPEQKTYLPKTAAQATGGNPWNERVVAIKKGDTLDAILLYLGATPEEIKAIAAKLGTLASDGNLKEGQKLRVLLSPVRGTQRLQPMRIMVVGDQNDIQAVVALSDLGRYVNVDVPGQTSVPAVPYEIRPGPSQGRISAKSDRVR